MQFSSEVVASNIGETRQAITALDLSHLYQHFEEALTTIGFLDREKPKYLMRRIKRLFNRADLDRNELQILHGMLRAASSQQQKTKHDD